MQRIYLKVLAVTFFWLAASLSSLSLLLEYPQSVSSVLWRTYPGLFQWPVVFFPFCCLLLFKPLELTWRFLSTVGDRARALRLLFVALIAIGVFGLSGYEWFNGKPAVWELAPEVTARAAPPAIPERYRGDPFVMSVRSFDDLALSIRARAPEVDQIPQCRFSGTNLPLYRKTECFCAPARMVTLGEQCDRVRQVWYNALAVEIARPQQRSYTYYTTRLSFTIMAFVFMTGLVTVVFMSCFTKEMSKGRTEAFGLARIFIQMFAVLAAAWLVQRLYLIYEQATIFPSDDRAVFVSSVYTIFAGALVLLGLIYAFSLKIPVLRSFIETFLTPFLIISSTILGVAKPELIASFLRSMFGVDATGPALIGFFAFMIFVSMLPLIYWLRGRNTPPPKRPRGGKRGSVEAPGQSGRNG